MGAGAPGGTHRATRFGARELSTIKTADIEDFLTDLQKPVGSAIP
jgi:hypothetical protein